MRYLDPERHEEAHRSSSVLEHVEFLTPKKNVVIPVEPVERHTHTL